jgi:hypothetical protein
MAMSHLRFTIIVAFAIVVGNMTAAAQQTREESSPIAASCPVTKRPSTPFIPPWPYPAVPGKIESGSFWFGTDRLWTILSDTASWKWFPRADGTLREKLPWYRGGYDWRAEPKPKLIVTGKRLDGPAPPLAVDGPNAVNPRSNQQYMMVGINIPTPGCWEVTGLYGGDELSYVVWVTE